MRVEVVFSQNCRFVLGSRTRERRALLVEYLRSLQSLLLSCRGQIPDSEPFPGKEGVLEYQDGSWRILYSIKLERRWFRSTSLKIEIHLVELSEE